MSFHSPRLIRVATSPDQPYVGFDKQTNTWNGILVTVFNAVCKRINATCEYSLPADLNNGYGISEAEWLEGVMGAVTNNTADIGVTPVGMTSKRFEHFNYIDSYFKTSYYVVIHKSHLKSVPASEFIMRAVSNLYSKNAWIGLFLIFIWSVAIGTFLDIWQRKLQGRNNIRYVRLSYDWFFRILGSGLGYAGIEDFSVSRQAQTVLRSSSTIVFLTTWLLYTLHILNSLTGQLPVMLTFNIPKTLPFTDAQSLLDSNFTIYGTKTAVEMLTATRTEVLHTVASRVLHLPKPADNSSKFAAYVETAKQGRNALIMSHKTLLEVSYINCDLFVAIDEIGSLSVAAVLIAKNSTLQDILQFGYARAQEDGIVQAGFKQNQLFMANATKPRLYSTQSCYRQKVVKSYLKRQTIRLDHVSFLLVVFVGALGVCCFAFLSEFLLRAAAKKTRP